MNKCVISPFNKQALPRLKSISVGLFDGIISIISTLALALLVFPGDLASFLPEGTTFALLSAGIVGSLIACQTMLRLTYANSLIQAL